jgi:hypothetical protein
MNTALPVTWGFLVDRANESQDIQELFKLWLDPAYEDKFENQPSLEEARKWFVDYMSFLYKAIGSHFTDWNPRWTAKHVQFLFSVPTTWKSPAMIAEMEKLIKQAGFGENPKHTSKIFLTEAEAAAVYAATQSYEKDDVLLVCDAGGGTTDVNILKVAMSAYGRIKLKPLSWVQGEAIGSTIIDRKVEKMIRSRLEKVRPFLPGYPILIAEKMILGRFETFKCSFGTEGTNGLDLFLPIPGMSGGLDFPQVNIEDSKLRITQ